MTGTGARSKRILVVDDEPAICNFCQRVLTKEGFEADTASNGKVAQGAIKRKQYDLCLLDIRMPEMDGRQLYLWMKQEGLELAKGVVFTSGSAVVEHTQAFLKESGRPFLPKPFSVSELTAMVKEALGAPGK